ncbi:MAG: methyltransferase domain-containing protein [Candidatus Sumerlaeota bacterium]|nr:methyltransferase domain-containing protein [Candidatus Sumerlaeota bacterium]
MNTETKIRIDRWAGLPLMFVVNLLARLTGKILRIDHSIAPEKVRRVVVAKFLGMGSIIQSTPMLRALKERFPNAELVFLSAKANRELVERLPFIDRALFVDDRGLLSLFLSSVRVAGRLARLRADLYLDLEVYSAYACLMAVFSLARNRLGFYRASGQFKKGIYTHLMYFNLRRPIHALYLQLARMADPAIPADGPLAPPRVGETDRSTLWEKLNDSHDGPWGAPYLVVNPNASDLLPQRRWPVERFARMVEALAAEGRRIALIGAAGEASYVRALKGLLPGQVQKRVADTAGRLSLGELLALLEGAACVVSNDSGPLHLAMALGRPAVGFFGPVNPEHYGFPRPNARALYHAVFCSPCAHQMDRPACGRDNVCMRQIEVPEVLEAVHALLEAAGGAPAPPGREPVPSTDAHALPLGRIVRASVDLNSPRPCEACSARRFRRLFELGDLVFERCAACGLERIANPPDKAALHSLYGQRYYDSWGLQEGADAARAVKMGSFRRWLGALGAFPPGARALDCGAATGYLMEVARERGMEPYGIEISDFGAAEIARKFGADRIFAGPFEEARFPSVGDGEFHAVLMCDFLEHVRDPLAALRKAHQWLAPGGRILIVTPNADSWSRRLMGRYWLHYKPEHLFYLARRSLALLLAEAGFNSIEIAPAWKTMTLKYLIHQFRTYRHAALTPAFNCADLLLPSAWKSASFSVVFGEMRTLARRGRSNRMPISHPQK